MWLLHNTQHMAADVWHCVRGGRGGKGKMRQREGTTEWTWERKGNSRKRKAKRWLKQRERGRLGGRQWLQRMKKDERLRGKGREMERSLKALKHFALPAQQMPHSVWHSELWACSIYTLTVSLQGQHKTHNAQTHVSGIRFLQLPCNDWNKAG